MFSTIVFIIARLFHLHCCHCHSEPWLLFSATAFFSAPTRLCQFEVVASVTLVLKNPRYGYSGMHHYSQIELEKIINKNYEDRIFKIKLA